MHTRRLVPLLGALVLCLLPLGAADAGQPAKNATYAGSVHPYDTWTVDVSVKVGADTSRVKQVTVTVTCPAGTTTKTFDDVRIRKHGIFSAPRHISVSDPIIVGGQFKTAHKIKGTVQSEQGPCASLSGIYDFTAKD